MKRSLFVTLLVVLVGVLILSGCTSTGSTPSPKSSPAQTSTIVPTTAPVAPSTSSNPIPKQVTGDKPIILRLTSHDPPAGPGGKTVTAWANKLEEITKGRVKVELYHSGSLASGPAAYDAVVTGVADLAWSTQGFYAGRFDITNIIGMPFTGIKDSMMSSKTLWHLWGTFPELKAEYKDTHMIALSTTEPGSIGSKVAIRTLDELKGKKIRTVAGGSLSWIQSAGGVPMMMSPGDIYPGMEKGIIDGWAICLEGASGFRLNEVTNYYMLPNFYVSGFFLVMNQQKYNSMAPDLQKAIDSLGGATYIEQIHAPIWDSGAAKKIMNIKTEQFTTLPQKDIDKAIEISKGVWKAETARLEAKGIPAQKIFDEMQKYISTYK